jgi:hypothetical protein
MKDEKRLEEHKCCRLFVKLMQDSNEEKISGLMGKDLGQITTYGLKCKDIGADWQSLA